MSFRNTHTPTLAEIAGKARYQVPSRLVRGVKTYYLTPVSQTFATYNGPVQDMTYMIKNDPAVIHFSKSPLWGWEFGNCMLAESNDGYDNVKPVKSSPTAKVDNVQALLSALWLYCQVNGTVQK